MPTYRYRCRKCGDEFETWQSIKDEPLHRHDHGCGGELLKVLTPAGIVLKGSGFYKTDSRSGSRRSGTAGGDTAEGGSGDAKKPDGGGDSKSAKPDAGTKPAGDASKTSGGESQASSSTS
jgi:putative FmdB family regulatory protein